MRGFPRWCGSREANTGAFDPLAESFSFVASVCVSKVLVGSRVRINRHARLAALKLDNLVHCFNALEKAGVSVEQIRPKGVCCE